MAVELEVCEVCDGAHANRCEEILLFGDSSVTSPQRHLDSSNLSAVSFHQNVDSPVPTPPTWLRVRAFHCVHLGEGAFQDRDRFHCYDLRTGGRGRAGVSLSSLAPVLCRTVGPSIDRVLSSLSLSLSPLIDSIYSIRGEKRRTNGRTSPSSLDPRVSSALRALAQSVGHYQRASERGVEIPLL